MNSSAEFDIGQGHRFFSADCFNRAWSLIDKPGRSAEEDQQMLLLSLTSLWHWTQRDDCTSRHLSIGSWQVARIYALLEDPGNAMQYAEQCLRYSRDEPAFYLAYAHEAAARAALLAGDTKRMQDHLQQARGLYASVDDPDERAMLERDLASIK